MEKCNFEMTLTGIYTVLNRLGQHTVWLVISQGKLGVEDDKVNFMTIVATVLKVLCVYWACVENVQHL